MLYVVALGNNYLYMYNDIMFPSLPMSTLYGTVIMTLSDDIFKFTLIAEQLELNLTEMIFTISKLISCSWSASFTILWTVLLFGLLHTSLKWVIL